MSENFISSAQSLGLSAPEKITVKHDVSQFDCEESSINEYVKTAYKQAVLKNAVVYVVCKTGTNIVKGFYTLSSGAVLRNEATKNMQRNSPKNISVTILGRFGVDKQYQSNGVGKDLLKDAIGRCILSAQTVGSRAILVHALDARLAMFYSKNAGFEPSPISDLTLFLAL